MPASNTARKPDGTPRALYIEMDPIGLSADVLENRFNPEYPYSYCRICGYVCQPPFQRTRVLTPVDAVNEPNDSLEKKLQRRDMMLKHEKKHRKDGSLSRYERSGYYFTPEATLALIPYGIIPVSEIALQDEHSEAASEAKRMPF